MSTPGPDPGVDHGDGDLADAALAADGAAPLPGVDHARIEAAVREILLAVGEDPDRDGLVDTPARVARYYAEVFGGLRQDPRA